MQDLSAADLRADWNYPTAVRFGDGRVREVPDVCRVVGIHRPLLVTDRDLAALPMTTNTLEACRGANLDIALFAEVQGDPTGSNVETGVAAFRKFGCDGVIAFGGGSALDTGKAIAFMAGQDREIWDFEDAGDNYKRARTEAIAPVVAVPTTAGTGSEVGRAAVITDEGSRVKKIIFHPRMMPRVAVLDPGLTVTLPRTLTAATGMDALAHVLEAYCAPGFHPLADGIALEGMRLVNEFLYRACLNGHDMEARAGMLAAAAMGATAFQKGLGAVHALSHPIGALYHIHHGLTNAILLPYVLAWNRPAVESRITRAARYMNLSDPTFDGFLDWVLELRERLAIPPKLSELGVDDDDVERLSEMAARDPSAAGNPMKVGAPELARICRRAITGRLRP